MTERYGYKAGWKSKVVVPVVTIAALGIVVAGGIAVDRYFSSRNKIDGTTNNNAGIGAPKTSEAAGPPAINPSLVHANRLLQLDSVFRTQGLGAWLGAAGVRADSITVVARQPEEEIILDANGQPKIVAAGVQVELKNANIPWPVVITTDQPVPNGRSYQPDQTNPSRLSTDITGFSGKATLWADGSNWQQLAPTK